MLLAFVALTGVGAWGSNGELEPPRKRTEPGDFEGKAIIFDGDFKTPGGRESRLMDLLELLDEGQSDEEFEDREARFFSFKRPSFKRPKLPSFKPPKLPSFKPPKLPSFKPPKLPSFNFKPPSNPPEPAPTSSNPPDAAPESETTAGEDCSQIGKQDARFSACELCEYSGSQGVSLTSEKNTAMEALVGPIVATPLADVGDFWAVSNGEAVCITWQPAENNLQLLAGVLGKPTDLVPTGMQTLLNALTGNAWQDGRELSRFALRVEEQKLTKATMTFVAEGTRDLVQELARIKRVDVHREYDLVNRRLVYNVDSLRGSSVKIGTIAATLARDAMRGVAESGTLVIEPTLSVKSDGEWVDYKIRSNEFDPASGVVDFGSFNAAEGAGVPTLEPFLDALDVGNVGNAVLGTLDDFEISMLEVGFTATEICLKSIRAEWAQVVTLDDIMSGPAEALCDIFENVGNPCAFGIKNIGVQVDTNQAGTSGCGVDQANRMISFFGTPANSGLLNPDVVQFTLAPGVPTKKALILSFDPNVIATSLMGLIPAMPDVVFELMEEILQMLNLPKIGLFLTSPAQRIGGYAKPDPLPAFYGGEGGNKVCRLQKAIGSGDHSLPIMAQDFAGLNWGGAVWVESGLSLISFIDFSNCNGNVVCEWMGEFFGGGGLRLQGRIPIDPSEQLMLEAATSGTETKLGDTGASLTEISVYVVKDGKSPGGDDDASPEQPAKGTPPAGTVAANLAEDADSLDVEPPSVEFGIKSTLKHEDWPVTFTANLAVKTGKPPSIKLGALMQAKNAGEMWKGAFGIDQLAVEYMYGSAALTISWPPKPDEILFGTHALIASQGSLDECMGPLRKSPNTWWRTNCIEFNGDIRLDFSQEKEHWFRFGLSSLTIGQIARIFWNKNPTQIPQFLRNTGFTLPPTAPPTAQALKFSYAKEGFDSSSDPLLSSLNTPFSIPTGLTFSGYLNLFGAQAEAAIVLDPENYAIFANVSLPYINLGPLLQMRHLEDANRGPHFLIDFCASLGCGTPRAEVRISGKMQVGPIQQLANVTFTPNHGGHLHVLVSSTMYGVDVTGEIEAKGFTSFDALTSGNVALAASLTLDTARFKRDLIASIDSLIKGIETVGASVTSGLSSARQDLQDELDRNRQCAQTCEASCDSGIGAMLSRRRRVARQAPEERISQQAPEERMRQLLDQLRNREAAELRDEARDARIFGDIGNFLGGVGEDLGVVEKVCSYQLTIIADKYADVEEHGCGLGGRSILEYQAGSYAPASACVGVNHIHDNPGSVTCDCVSPNNQCLADGVCVLEAACDPPGGGGAGPNTAISGCKQYCSQRSDCAGFEFESYNSGGGRVGYTCRHLKLTAGSTWPLTPHSSKSCHGKVGAYGLGIPGRALKAAVFPNKLCHAQSSSNQMTPSIVRPYSLWPGATCEPGYAAITSSWEDCRAAGVSLGYTGDSVAHVSYWATSGRGWGTSRPQGCFLADNGRIHFNRGAGGNFLGSDKILCAKSGGNSYEDNIDACKEECYKRQATSSNCDGFIFRKTDSTCHFRKGFRTNSCWTNAGHDVIVMEAPSTQMDVTPRYQGPENQQFYAGCSTSGNFGKWCRDQAGVAEGAQVVRRHNHGGIVAEGPCCGSSAAVKWVKHDRGCEYELDGLLEDIVDLGGDAVSAINDGFTDIGDFASDTANDAYQGMTAAVGAVNEHVIEPTTDWAEEAGKWVEGAVEDGADWVVEAGDSVVDLLEKCTASLGNVADCGCDVLCASKCTGERAGLEIGKAVVQGAEVVTSELSSALQSVLAKLAGGAAAHLPEATITFGGSLANLQANLYVSIRIKWQNPTVNIDWNTNFNVNNWAEEVARIAGDLFEEVMGKTADAIENELLSFLSGRRRRIKME